MSELIPEVVSPAMIEAGLERLTELRCEADLAYVVEAIYLAMEYQRFEPSSEFRRLHDHIVQECSRLSQ
jgi:hypothetical protein